MTHPLSLAKTLPTVALMLTLMVPQLALAASKSEAKKADPGEAPVAPALWGYGNKSCGAFLASAPSGDVSADVVSSDYQRYREWLSGFVSGLNLATGRDVLRGAEIDAAMERVRANCRSHPKEDVFNASLRLVRSLGQLGKK